MTFLTPQKLSQMNKKQLLIVFGFNLCIAFGFFAENWGIGFSELSTDSQNSIPVCYKIDNQKLFQNDLYLNSLDNVKYYTPFYINSIRFFSYLTNGNYILAINWFATMLHLLYGVLWFYLFYYYFEKNFWVAFLLSVIIRGIVWLPGYEIWGISDIWTIMPRTYYSTFLPIPFILLLFKNKLAFILACFSIGFILNLHPITGIGGLILFGSLVFGYLVWFHKSKIPWLTVILGLIAIFVGILPFLMVYFTKTDSHISYKINEYKLAFNYRIPVFFEQPSEYLKSWIDPKILFYFIPLMLYFFVTNFYKKKDQKKAIILIFITFMTIVLPSISIYLETYINTNYNQNIRMAFQVIRAQRLAILPGFFALGYLLVYFFQDKKYLSFLTIMFLFTVSISKLELFSSIPFFGDDISRSIFPTFDRILLSSQEKQTDMDKMAKFISSNTPKNAVFYGDFMLRSAAKRAVILDGKGASMLIEGNPVQLIKWYKESIEYQTMTTLKDSMNFLKSKKANYFISKKIINNKSVSKIHTINQLNLYLIN